MPPHELAHVRIERHVHAATRGAQPRSCHATSRRTVLLPGDERLKAALQRGSTEEGRRGAGGDRTAPRFRVDWRL